MPIYFIREFNIVFRDLHILVTVTSYLLIISILMLPAFTSILNAVDFLAIVYCSIDTIPHSFRSSSRVLLPSLSVVSYHHLFIY